MAILGETLDSYRSSYLAKRSGGMRKKDISEYDKYDSKMWKRRKRAREQKGSDDAAFDRKTAGFQSDFKDMYENRSKIDYAGQDIENKYGKDVADTIMDAHSKGLTGNYSRYTTGDEGGLTENNFGDVAMAAGRIQDRRDLRTKLDEGRYGGGTGRGQSASGGQGFNIFSSSATTKQKKKKSNLLGSGEVFTGGSGNMLGAV